jgi:hypothetical protein
MHADAAHRADIADCDLLSDIAAACRWWGTQRTWLVSSSYTGGGVIAALEQFVARRVARDATALALPSATAALVTALRAVGLQPGATIGVPALNWTGAGAAARSLGLRTRALPVSPATGVLDTAWLMLHPEFIDDLAAVIVVHLHGVTCDVPVLRRARPGLPIIEDAAQAWAARYPDGAPVGSAADACAFSFGAAKSPSAGELGCLVTRTSPVYRKAVELTQHPVRQLLAGVTSPRADQPMFRVSPVAALLGAYTVQRHASQIPRLRQAGLHLATALRQANLSVLSNADLHAPGVVAARATTAQVRVVIRSLELGHGITIASVDQSDLHVHPEADQDHELRQLSSAITTVTIACRRRTHCPTANRRIRYR